MLATTEGAIRRPPRPVTGIDRAIAHLLAYIDTLHVFIAGAPIAGDRQQLEKIYGRRVRMVMTRRWNPMTFRKDIIGFIVMVQCPSLDLLELLGAMQRERGGSLRRLDISFDWRSNILSFDQLTKWIREHLVMRHRESGVMNTYEGGGTYYVLNAQGSERSIDNLFYPDRVSKRDWLGPLVNKNESRIRGHENIQRVYGITHADEIPLINPAAVFVRCFDITQTFDGDRVAVAVQKAMRRNLRTEREQHLKRQIGRNEKPSAKQLARQERYRAMLPKREARIWANRDLEYVQRVKDIFPGFLIPSNDQIHVASRLSWDAKGSRA